MILDGLRDGHNTQAELAAYVAARRPEVPARASYVRTIQVLQKMRRAGQARHEAGAWLAPLGQPESQRSNTLTA